MGGARRAQAAQFAADVLPIIPDIRARSKGRHGLAASILIIAAMVQDKGYGWPQSLMLVYMA
jgi:hypothetical protein